MNLLYGSHTIPIMFRCNAIVHAAFTSAHVPWYASLKSKSTPFEIAAIVDMTFNPGFVTSRTMDTNIIYGYAKQNCFLMAFLR